jgi:hypothetical protein
MIDDLELTWDSEFQKKKKALPVKKITPTTEVHLEEYFAFLKDVVPSFKKPSEPADTKRKVFTLD